MCGGPPAGWPLGRACPSFASNAHERRTAGCDPTTNVAHHYRLAELEIKYVARVHARVDTADDAQRLVGREREAGERAAGGEVGIPSDELVDRDGHRRLLSMAIELSNSDS